MADFCMVVFYDNGSKKDKKKKGLTEHILYISQLWDAAAPLAILVTFILASEEDHSMLLHVTEVQNGTRRCGLMKGSDLLQV